MKLGAKWMREWGGNQPTQIYPIGDLRDHVTEGGDCWCNPSVEHVGEAEIITHNSMDQRERFETGERKPS